MARVALYLVRHAKAGDRRRWAGPGPDRDRPLSEKGWRQAEALRDLLLYELGDRRPQVLSSPYARCVQTVEPLAAKLGRAVDERSELAEGAAARDVVALARRLASTTAVLCSHGDTIPSLLDALADEDDLVLPGSYPLAKCSTWVLATDHGRFVGARYLPPPN